MSSDSENDSNVNRECVTLLWLDVRRDTGASFLAALRAINDCLRIYTETSACLEWIKSAEEKIFFISSSSSNEVLGTAHQYAHVEAIFVLDADANGVRGDFPKLIDIFKQQEELLRVLRITMETFERIQLEAFAFATDKIFLWWQLWKEQVKSLSFFQIVEFVLIR